MFNYKVYWLCYLIHILKIILLKIPMILTCTEDKETDRINTVDCQISGVVGKKYPN